MVKSPSIKLIIRIIALFFLLHIAVSCRAESTEKNWGIYQIYWHPDQYRTGLLKQLAQLQGKPKYVLFFRDLVRDFPTDVVKLNDSLGLISIVSMELQIWGRYRSKNVLNEIVEGKFDTYFKNWAQKAGKYGKKVIYRFGFEMNGNWFPWGKKPELFKKAWIHVHGIFQKQKALNVEWLFSPNVLWKEKTFELDIKPYYPGEAYVSMVGLDGYNFGDHHDKWHNWESYSSVFESSINGMASLGKPLIISEIGCAPGKNKANWMKDFLTRFSQDIRVQAFVYFNLNKSSEGETNWRIDSDSESLKVFKNSISKPPFLHKKSK